MNTSKSITSTLSTRFLGEEAEEIAANYLYLEGYKVIHRNFYTRFGELDLVCRLGDKLVFVEVKSLDAKYAEDIFATITPRKMQRLRSSIEIWLKAFSINHPEATPRLDFIGIVKQHNHYCIHHLDYVG